MRVRAWFGADSETSDEQIVQLKSRKIDVLTVRLFSLAMQSFSFFFFFPLRITAMQGLGNYLLIQRA